MGQLSAGSRCVLCSSGKSKLQGSVSSIIIYQIKATEQLTSNSYYQKIQTIVSMSSPADRHQIRIKSTETFKHSIQTTQMKKAHSNKQTVSSG